MYGYAASGGKCELVSITKIKDYEYAVKFNIEDIDPTGTYTLTLNNSKDYIQYIYLEKNS